MTLRNQQFSLFDFMYKAIFTLYIARKVSLYKSRPNSRPKYSQLHSRLSIEMLYAIYLFLYLNC